MKFLEVIGFIAVLLGCDGVASQEFASDQEYLHVWKNREDVLKFIPHICELSLVESPNIFAIIERTVDSLREDPLSLFRIFLEVDGKHGFSFMPHIEKVIQRELKNAADRVPLSFNRIDLNTPKYYSVREGWLLLCSQTENGEGKRLIDGFNKNVTAHAEDVIVRNAIRYRGNSEVGNLLNNMLLRILELKSGY